MWKFRSEFSSHHVSHYFVLTVGICLVYVSFGGKQNYVHPMFYHQLHNSVHGRCKRFHLLCLGFRLGTPPFCCLEIIPLCPSLPIALEVSQVFHNHLKCHSVCHRKMFRGRSSQYYSQLYSLCLFTYNVHKFFSGMFSQLRPKVEVCT